MQSLLLVARALDFLFLIELGEPDRNRVVEAGVGSVENVVFSALEQLVDRLHLLVLHAQVLVLFAQPLEIGLNFFEFLLKNEKCFFDRVDLAQFGFFFEEQVERVPIVADAVVGTLFSGVTAHFESNEFEIII